MSLETDTFYLSGTQCYLKEKQIGIATIANTKHIPKQRIYTNYDWLTALLLASLVLLVIIRLLFFRRFTILISAFFSVRLFNQFMKEGSFLKELLSVFLFGAYLIIMSGFIYLLFNHVFTEFINNKDSKIIYLLIMGTLLGFYIIKMIIRYSVAIVFNTQSETLEHSANIFIFDMISALFLLPILIVQLYNCQDELFRIGLILIAAIYFYRLLRLIIIARNKSKFSAYYLFLYLCTVEILPVLVFGKLAMIYLKISV